MNDKESDKLSDKAMIIKTQSHKNRWWRNCFTNPMELLFNRQFVNDLTLIQ